jgi:hypothetical protein
MATTDNKPISTDNNEPITTDTNVDETNNTVSVDTKIPDNSIESNITEEYKKILPIEQKMLTKIINALVFNSHYIIIILMISLMLGFKNLKGVYYLVILVSVIILRVVIIKMLGNGIKIPTQLKEGVLKVAKSVGDGTKKAAKSVGEGAKKAAKSVGEGAKKAAKSVGKGTKKVARNIGKGTKKAVKSVGDGAKKVAKSVGKGTKKAVKSVGNLRNKPKSDKNATSDIQYTMNPSLSPSVASTPTTPPADKKASTPPADKKASTPPADKKAATPPADKKASTKKLIPFPPPTTPPPADKKATTTYDKRKNIRKLPPITIPPPPPSSVTTPKEQITEKSKDDNRDIQKNNETKEFIHTKNVDNMIDMIESKKKTIDKKKQNISNKTDILNDMNDKMETLKNNNNPKDSLVVKTLNRQINTKSATIAKKSDTLKKENKTLIKMENELSALQNKSIQKGGGNEDDADKTNDDDVNEYEKEKDLMTILCKMPKYKIFGFDDVYSSIFIFAFTAVYVISPMIISKMYNYHIIALLTLYAIIDIGVRIKCKKMPSISSLATNIIAGSSVSIAFIYIVISLGLENKLLYTEINQKKPSGKSSDKMPFKCEIFKGGKLLSSENILSSSPI